MNIARAVNELYVFASDPRAFRFDELFSLVDTNINSKELRKALLGKSRFICLHAESQCDDQFILDSTLFQWLSRLNNKLAQIKKFRLTERKLTSIINHLCKDGRWDSAPREAVHWGQSLGLICKAYTKDHFVFPLARILSFMKPRNLDISSRLLSDLCEKRIWEISLTRNVKESIKRGFSKYKDETSHIVRNREGLQAGKKVTLQKLGDYFNLSRERIRQVEEKFWHQLFLHDSYREPLLAAFLCDFMDNSGSLILDLNSRKSLTRRFLAKCAGIPQLEITRIGLIALATTAKDLDLVRSKKGIPDYIDAKLIANSFESRAQISLSRKDVQKIATRISQHRLKKLSLAKRVYLALHTIGKPSHYSEVTRVHNSLWPERILSEGSVHNALAKQKHGVVWIGMKGTYALRKWGYEKPSKTLFDTVKEIVRKKYEDMGVPIPIPVIIAEMGKYRKVVNLSSVAIAIHFNPGLKKVSKETFIPREPDDQDQEEISLNELDKIFKEFEEKV